MQILLFHVGDGPILFNSYVDEIRAFYHRFRQQSVPTFAYAAARIFTSLAPIRQDSRFPRLLHLAKRYRDPSSPLSTLDRLELRSFMQDYGLSIYVYLMESNANSLERLQSLVDSGRLRGQLHLVDSSIQADQDTVSFWNASLNHWRPSKDMQNFNDAHAMGLLYSFNSKHFSSQKPAKLLLFTRSRTMHSIFEDDALRWSNVGGPVLRHPRCLIGLLAAGSQNYSDDFDLAALADFRSTFDGLAVFRPAPNHTEGEATRRVEALVAETWRRLANLAAVTRISTPATASDQDLLRIVDIFINNNTARAHVISTMRRGFSHLSYVHKQLRVLFSTEFAKPLDLESALELERVEQAGSANGGEFVALATAAGVPLPFELVFRQRQVLELLRQDAEFGADPRAVRATEEHRAAVARRVAGRNRLLGCKPRSLGARGAGGCAAKWD